MKQLLTKGQALLFLWLTIVTAASAVTPQLILGMSASARDADAFSAMSSIGVKSVRFDVPWKLVEVKRGQYQIPDWVEATVNAATAANMQPLAILDYGNPLYGDDKPRSPEAIQAFSRYATFVVNHFKTRVIYYELWNEWETHTGKTTPSSPEDYVKFAKVVYPAIKAANPAVQVLMFGISDLTTKNLNGGWLDHFFQIGGLSYVDGISLHPYNQPGDEQSPETAIHIIDQVHEMAMNVDSSKANSIYVTEMGYTTFAGKYGVSEDAQADFLARFILLAASRPYVKGIWWYSLVDPIGADPANMQQHWGLFRKAHDPKPSSKMFANVAAILADAQEIDAKGDGGTYSVVLRKPTGVRTITWRKGSGNVMTFLDSDTPHQQRLLNLNLQRAVPLPPDDLRSR